MAANGPAARVVRDFDLDGVPELRWLTGSEGWHPFRLRQRDHFVDGSPGHPERYAVVGSQEQRSEPEQRLLPPWSAGGIVAIGFGHEDAVENVVAAPRSPQTPRVPVTDHLHLRRLDDHGPHHQPASLIVARCTVLAHQATGQDHRGVRDAAGETEPPRDHMAAGDPLRVAGGMELTGQTGVARTEPPLRAVWFQEPARETGGAGDHGAPAQGPIDPRELLDQLDLGHRIELRTTKLERHRRPTDARLAQRLTPRVPSQRASGVPNSF